jgi:hypothetical protein
VTICAHPGAGDNGGRLKNWVRSHRLHIAGTVWLALLLLPSLWFVLAYAGLPRIWSHHEHRKGKRGGDTVAYTAQDIPGDPINLEVYGAQAAIECRLQHGGWIKADDVSVRSGLQIGLSVLLDRPYPNAPVSPLYVHDKMQDVALQLDVGKSADRRHHVRFWQVDPGKWLGSATFDRGVGMSLFTLQITHHIGPDVDHERDAVARLLAGGGAATLITRPATNQRKVHRNGGGDKYMTDGKVARVTLGPPCTS